MIYTKAPNDKLDYDIDFSRWLELGDAIVAGNAVVTTATGALPNSTISTVIFDTTTIKVWVDGGSDNSEIHITAVATTSAGRIKEQCFTVRNRSC